MSSIHEHIENRKNKNSQNEDDLMDYSSKLRDNYTKELLKYASMMKSNALNTEQFLENEKLKLEKMGKRADENYHLAKDSTTDMSKLLSLTSNSIWTDIYIICFVIISFFIVYMFIKIT